MLVAFLNCELYHHWWKKFEPAIICYRKNFSSIFVERKSTISPKKKKIEIDLFLFIDRSFTVALPKPQVIIGMVIGKLAYVSQIYFSFPKIIN